LAKLQQWWQQWDYAYRKMATGATGLPIPRNEGEEDNIVVPVDPAVWDEVRVTIRLDETIYRLKVPTFTVKNQ